ncbi:hypothetical protein GCM10007073_09070 [Micrococcus flavus]|nr:hypothetical protein GCM10007073_09070 [Micrococcus flavus]
MCVNGSTSSIPRSTTSSITDEDTIEPRVSNTACSQGHDPDARVQQQVQGQPLGRGPPMQAEHLLVPADDPRHAALPHAGQTGPPREEARRSPVLTGSRSAVGAGSPGATSMPDPAALGGERDGPVEVAVATAQLVQQAQRGPRGVAQVRVRTLGLQLGHHHERQDHLVLGEVQRRPGVREEHGGVHHVGPPFVGQCRTIPRTRRRRRHAVLLAERTRAGPPAPDPR